MSLSADALATLANAKTYMRVEHDDDDTIIELMIESASKKVEAYTGRVFVARDVSETRVADGSQMLRLWKQPVNDVTSVSVNGTALSSWTERLSIGRIYSNAYEFGLDDELIIVYNAGAYENQAAVASDVPEVVMAVLMMVSDMYENRSDTASSVNVAGVGTTTYSIPSRAQEILNPLRIPQC